MVGSLSTHEVRPTELFGSVSAAEVVAMYGCSCGCGRGSCAFGRHDIASVAMSVLDYVVSAVPVDVMGVGGSRG